MKNCQKVTLIPNFGQNSPFFIKELQKKSLGGGEMLHSYVYWILF
jgi:hypothetical protein